MEKMPVTTRLKKCLKNRKMEILSMTIGKVFANFRLGKRVLRKQDEET